MSVKARVGTVTALGAAAALVLAAALIQTRSSRAPRSAGPVGAPRKSPTAPTCRSKASPSTIGRRHRRPAGHGRRWPADRRGATGRVPSPRIRGPCRTWAPQPEPYSPPSGAGNGGSGQRSGEAEGGKTRRGRCAGRAGREARSGEAGIRCGDSRRAPARSPQRRPLSRSTSEPSTPDAAPDATTVPTSRPEHPADVRDRCRRRRRRPEATAAPLPPDRRDRGHRSAAGGAAAAARAGSSDPDADAHPDAEQLKITPRPGVTAGTPVRATLRE